MIISINVIPIIIHYIYHHKSWQILSIFMEAMASELLVSYVKSHYLSFTSGACNLGVRNPNKFMAEVVFTYCLALHVFRAGVRRNN